MRFTTVYFERRSLLVVDCGDPQSGARYQDRCVIDGPAQIRGACPGGGRTFFRTSLRRAPDRERGALSSRTLNAGEYSCRERAVEAESAQPPDSRRVPGGWN